MTDLAQTFHDLVRFETALWNAVDARLQADCAVTLARFETLQVIGRSGSCRVLDIAEELGIGWAGVSKIVDRAVAADHCRRRPNPDDARSSLITLTPRGRALLRKAAASFTDELELRLGGALTPTQLAGFARLLARLRATAASGSPTVVPGRMTTAPPRLRNGGDPRGAGLQDALECFDNQQMILKLRET